MANKIQKIELFGIKLDSMPKKFVIEKIFELTEKKSSSIICTINVEFIMRALSNHDFFNILNKKSSLNLIDGSGVIWGYCVLNSWKPQTPIAKEIYVSLHMVFAILLYPLLSTILCKKYYKVSGADIAIDIAKEAVSKSKTLFLLGNKFGLDPNAVQKASLELQTKIYNLRIVGAVSSSASDENKKILVEEIKKSGADFLYCAFGSPDQEYWLTENLSKSGAKVGIGLGGTLDFIAGTQKRAPRFVSTIGFEWLYRLIRQPKRIKRQKSLIDFIKLVYKTRLID